MCYTITEGRPAFPKTKTPFVFIVAGEGRRAAFALPFCKRNEKAYPPYMHARCARAFKARQMHFYKYFRK